MEILNDPLFDDINKEYSEENKKIIKDIEEMDKTYSEKYLKLINDLKEKKEKANLDEELEKFIDDAIKNPSNN